MFIGLDRIPETLADRSIVVNMERKLISEKCAPLVELDAMTIKRQCVPWAEDNEPTVRDWRRINLEDINDRASDTFEPLMVTTELKEMSSLADEAALEETAKTDREGKRLSKILNGAAKIAGQEAVNEFEATLQRVKDEKEAEEMELEEKDFKQELGITEGKCVTP